MFNSIREILCCFISSADAEECVGNNEVIGTIVKFSYP